jgi:uncharacterized protein (TIGR03083 family)
MTIQRHSAMAGLWAAVLDVVDGLKPADWERTVPSCPAWSVADLVSHLGALQSALNGAPQPEAPAEIEMPEGASVFDHAMAAPVAARKHWTPEQRVDELRDAITVHVAALEATTDWLTETPGPVGTTTMDGLFKVRSFDIWVHLQDLREALGLRIDLDDESDGAATAHQYVLGLVPWMSVKRAGAEEGATLRVALGSPINHDSVLHVVNRRAAWDPTADPGDDLVIGSPGALTMLVAGRGTREQWREAGALEWAGPLGDAFTQRARLF